MDYNAIFDRITDLSSVTELRKELEPELLKKNFHPDKEAGVLYRMLSIAEKELQVRDDCLFSDGKNRNIQDLVDLEENIKKYIYRFWAGDFEDEVLNGFENFVKSGISVYAFLVYINYLNCETEDLIVDLSRVYECIGERNNKILLLCAALKFTEKQNKIRIELLKEYLNLEMMKEAEDLVKESIERDGTFQTLLEELQ